MELFNHFILTKFNVRCFPDLMSGCDPTWLENRFRLFNQYCFPSVYNQSNQNFKWLVFFDVDTPNLFKQKISEYTATWKNFVPLYLNSPLPYGEFSTEARDTVRKEINPDCKYLITTWLDNDDAIHQDYINMIQDNFCQQEMETLNFIFGYQLSSGKLYFDFELANHFISLVEKYNSQSFMTCLCRPHKEIYQVCSSVQKIICKPVWIEVVHSSNYKNVYRRGVRIPIGSILKNYHIETEEAEDRERFIPFLVEQTKILFFFSYYFLRKIFLRFKNKQLHELSISRYTFKNY